MFSNEQLQDLIDGKIVGDKYPFDTHNIKDIEAHIKQLFYKMNRIPNIICEAEWDHFGSGYASFVEFFCYRKEDVVIMEEKYGIQEIKTSGIIIDICRLAPVAIMGEDERYKTIRKETNEVVRGAYGTILDGSFGLHEKFQRMAEPLKRALREFDYELLEAEQLQQPLPFETKIPTIYREPHEYLVMDAIFYWED
ncbi:hypothetical protein JCM9140_4801 [Halalkalibacter wakoensis JCM 9140]|uniref:Uncharacterized protein n=1 Tax=Halalkalibacter wakoensis JCM 9140 TaxID=1236970 RepID=W4Q980_9BACI|nr:hypothetical protein [Halalkalibacter wakoensis]GAE28555.1 hypothetical protein JCM9140_4801 [Halalkalibacter wakoensis JCM 9140]